MSGHLCLKWNNHSSAFLKNICKIQVKEKYCDATIVCQGKYFPVHRIILSTCSEYFEEIFERMQCQHPYIVFKDIEPTEMEMLLNYMYQGEVNVVQEMLPSLIKAAEALRIKGLAVPDDMPTSKETSGKKRSNCSTNDEPEPKRRSEVSDKRASSEVNQAENIYSNNDINTKSSENSVTHPRLIKEEPVDTGEYGSSNLYPDFGSGGVSALATESSSKEERGFVDYPEGTDTSTYIKTEGSGAPEQTFQDQSAGWTDFGSENPLQNLPSVTEMSQQGQEDIFMAFLPPPPSSSAMDLQIRTNNFHSERRSGDPSLKKLAIHQCPSCSYKSYKKHNVKTHIRLKHLKDKPFHCPICPRRFALKQQIQSHMRTHSRKRDFELPSAVDLEGKRG